MPTRRHAAELILSGWRRPGSAVLPYVRRTQWNPAFTASERTGSGVSGRERISHFDAGPGDARGMRLAESLTAGGKGAGPKPPDYRRTRSECERAGLP